MSSGVGTKELKPIKALKSTKQTDREEANTEIRRILRIKTKLEFSTKMRISNCTAYAQRGMPILYNH